MAEAESETDAARCRALTAEGARCSRTAGADGFCYQHDEPDPTVDDAQASDGGPDGERTEGDDTMSTEEAEAEQEEESTAETEPEEESTAEADPESTDQSAETAEEPVADVEDSADAGAELDDESESDAAEGSASAGADLWDARETAERVANELIDDPFDGIIEITRAEEGDGWTGVVEVVERSAIPDTQDILGRYEVSIGGDGDLEGYRLTGRYRRGDVSDEQAPER